LLSLIATCTMPDTLLSEQRKWPSEFAMNQWYVLRCSTTKYFGVSWTYHNGSPRTPRQGLVSLDMASTYPNRKAALDDLRRAHDLTGVTFTPVAISFTARGGCVAED
jgi:hypothetical protein